MPHRNLYPYWNEIFEDIGETFSSFEELEEVLSLPAVPIRPPDPSSEDVTTLRFSLEVRDKNLANFSSEFQMTIRPLVNLKPTALSILLKSAVIEACHNGVDISLYMAMFFLLELARSRLLHSQSDREYSHLAQAVCLGELVLLSVGREGWLTLTSRDQVHPNMVKAIAKSGWLPNRRTLNSWRERYAIESFLEMRIVPLEQFLEKEDKTIPYSSYTKGYHESGRGYRRDGKVYGEGKTPFDPEIDEDRNDVPVSHHSIDDDPVYIACIQAISKIRKERFATK